MVGGWLKMGPHKSFIKCIMLVRRMVDSSGVGIIGLRISTHLRCGSMIGLKVGNDNGTL